MPRITLVCFDIFMENIMTVQKVSKYILLINIVFMLTVKDCFFFLEDLP